MCSAVYRAGKDSCRWRRYFGPVSSFRRSQFLLRVKNIYRFISHSYFSWFPPHLLPPPLSMRLFISVLFSLRIASRIPCSKSIRAIYSYSGLFTHCCCFYAGVHSKWNKIKFKKKTTARSGDQERCVSIQPPRSMSSPSGDNLHKK